MLARSLARVHVCTAGTVVGMAVGQDMVFAQFGVFFYAYGVYLHWGSNTIPRVHACLRACVRVGTRNEP